MKNSILVLKIQSQKAPGEKIYRFDKSRIVFGTATSCDVRLEDASISPVHGILELNAGDEFPVLYDLASDSGVKVNGAATVQTAVKPQDQIQIGSFIIQAKKDLLEDVPVKTERVKEAFGQKLFVSEKEDLAPLLLEAESGVVDIFDRRPENKTSLQVVMFYRDTILDVEHFVDSKSVVIGPTQGEDFPIPPFFGSGKAGRFSLIQNDRGNYTLNVHSSMQGVVHQNGKMQRVEELVQGTSSKSIPLIEKDFAKVKVNDVSFFLNFTPAPPKLRARRLFDRDPLFTRIWITSFLFTTLLLSIVSSVQVDPKIEIEQLPERIATVIYEPKLLPVERKQEIVPPQPKEEPKPSIPVQPKVQKIAVQPKNVTKPAPKNAVIGEKPKPNANPAPPVPKLAGKPGPVKRASGQEGEGAKAKGLEGGRGEPNKPKANVAQNKALRPGEGSSSNAAATNVGKSEVQGLGVVDLFKSQKGTLNKILAAGSGPANAADKLEGYSGFTSQGEGGLGEAGTGKGGGGQSLGLGGLSNKGVGGGKKGTGLGALGSGGNILGGTGKLTVDSGGGGTGEPIVLGSIDTDAIARAIAAHRDEIKYCYEKEINADNPDLSGRIVVRFVIGASGSVSSAGISNTSLKNANTEQCVVQVIKRIQFPPVRGGGIAEVSYPFVFKPSNK